MPTIMDQVDHLSTSDKMRLIEHLVRSVSVLVSSQEKGGAERDPREYYFGCPRPDYSTLVGYGARFHTPRSTEDWMKELREGEAE